MNINGGAGIDTLVIIGTTADDTFVVYTDDQGVPRIFGAGVTIPQIAGVEKVLLLGGGGDDTVYLYETTAGLELEINLGSGDDTVIAGGAFDLPGGPSATARTLAGIDGPVTVSGLVGNDTLMIDNRDGLPTSEHLLGEDRLTGFGMQAGIEYSSFDTVDLYLSDVDDTVNNNVLEIDSTLGIALTRILAGLSGGRIDLKSAAGELEILGDVGDDVVYVSNDQRKLSGITAAVRIRGGQGNDRVVYDSSGETAGLTLSIGGTDDLGTDIDRTEVTGLLMAGSVTFDDPADPHSVEEVELILGTGADDVSVTLGGDGSGGSDPGDLRRVFVNGGDGPGRDSLSYTLNGQPVADSNAAFVIATGVEDVTFANEDNSLPTSWLLAEGQLWAGSPGNYDRLVLKTEGALSTELGLGTQSDSGDEASGDQLRVWSTLPTAERTVVHLRSGNDAAEIGQVDGDLVLVGQEVAGVEYAINPAARRLGDIASSLILSAGSGGDVLTVDDRHVGISEPRDPIQYPSNEARFVGSIDAGLISGFGIAEGASISYSEFSGSVSASGLTYRGPDLVLDHQPYDLTLGETATSTDIILGSGSDIVHVDSVSHPTEVNLGSGRITASLSYPHKHR